jgi:adenosylcobinamide kinase/adenosylcobinamide-phosphate guanylyltransferase
MSTASPPTLTLLLGGARSGKSQRALELAAHASRVLFVATGESLDDEMATRIAAHRRERPTHWATLEEPLALATALGSLSDSHDLVIIDCLTLWVSTVMHDDPTTDWVASTRALLDVHARGRSDWIVVSNEVGLGIVPSTPLGRAYRDALGTVNRLVAETAGVVTLMVAGLAVPIKQPAASG